MVIEKIIKVQWDGPFTYEEVKQFNGKKDYGIYIAFGNHRIYGMDSLLYVGKAFDQTFLMRINQHTDWPGTEYYYLGRICGIGKTTYKTWHEEVDYLETQIIQHCLPSWNASKLNYTNKTYEFENPIILNNICNFHKSQLVRILPAVMCNWMLKDAEKWEAFSNEDME